MVEANSINMMFHFLQEVGMNKEIYLVHCKSEDQLTISFCRNQIGNLFMEMDYTVHMFQVYYILIRVMDHNYLLRSICS